MPRLLAFWMVAAVISMTAQVRGASAEKAARAGQVGKPLAIKFAAVDGRQVDLGYLRGKVVLIDFWATWCAPCRMVAPVLDQLAVEYEGKAKVAKVDVDVNIKTSTKFNVRSIPAILFFKDGKLVDQVIGFVGKPALAEKFKQHAA